ncbi:aspartylglucosaminidase [Gaeumannomyces tritici R3-111a-1]|uniref:Aspartylglucosaminidase n=1 Tax=Gaeumannomyces tritici (strain R3-111a-1) TaxID=644352 RepID=J3NYP2_GAET3|nr:aspartylglucosaminidase [Gaeumannomyces tritici R3-111a-1]EJT76475.1 aspartylglucosaminidase [Gaeumannomyces tritici R3-111a-1]
MHRQLLAPVLALAACARAAPSPGLPMVINTWGGPFTAATDAAYDLIARSPASATAALDAVQAGCGACEARQCDGSVGFGGSPDESCETTLDAMIMDGATMKSGAVAGLRRVRDAVSVARAVLDRTSHSLLAGDLATAFAVQNGFREEGLATDASRARCAAWREAACQPNYRVNVEPDPRSSCGPYAPLGGAAPPPAAAAAQASHDTISMIAIDAGGAMAAATSTNGASFKVPGRVGDGPIVGSGSYVDTDVGGCGATGDGDIMMRFLPCYQALENLRQGMTPKQAAADAVCRMVRKYPAVASGIVVVNNRGEHGGAGSGWTFTYSFRGGAMNATEVVSVPPISTCDRMVQQ